MSRSAPRHISRHAIDRRTLLRGMLVTGGLATMGLPLFEAMLNGNGTALASGAPTPKRFGSWFWGVGAYKNNWLPATTGAGWQPTLGLAALAPVAPYVSIVSNTRFYNLPVVHYGGQALLLSGAWSATGADQETSAFGSPGGPSVDQLVAKAWKGTTAIPSVVVGVSEAFQGGCLAAANGSCVPPTQASWIDNNQPNYHEFSLSNFYNTLFGGSQVSLHTTLQRKSILDVVTQDMQSLRLRLGNADGQRLDAHAQAIRDMETSLKMAASTCAAPPLVSDIASPLAHEPLQERNRAFSDMLALALSCDLTRVFTVQFTGRENDTIFWQVGATDGTHTLSHVGTDASRATLNQALGFTMGELSYFLQKLQATQDGAGNLLDSCSIYITSCIGDPTAHSYDGDLLMMLAGKGGGSLTGGMHYAATTEVATSVAYTAMHAVGVDVGTFGSRGNECTAPLPALLA